MSANKFEKPVYAMAERVNSALKETGHIVKVEHRNNYTAIDLCKDASTGSADLLVSGLSDKNAHMFLRAMLKGIELFTNPVTKK